jgi:hypothetical protein
MTTLHGRPAVLAAALGLGLVLGAATAPAQELADYDYENLEFRGLFMEIGVVRPARVEAALAASLRADLGYLGPYVRILPSLGFWTSRLRSSEVRHLAEQIQRICERQTVGNDCPLYDLGEIRYSDLMVNADALYVPPLRLPFAPYVGAGLALHMINGSGELIDDTFIEDLLDTLSPGLNLIAGVSVPLGPRFEILAEVRGAFAPDISFGELRLGGGWKLAPMRAPASSPVPFRSR